MPLALTRMHLVKIIVPGLVLTSTLMGWKQGVAIRSRLAAPVRASAQPSGGAEAEAVVIIHMVQSGETLSLIARLYQVPVTTIRSANSLSSDQIRVGQALKIASGKQPVRHTVSSGESLWAIAARYGITTLELLDANRALGDEPGDLRIGQPLWIPGPGTMIARAQGVPAAATPSRSVRAATDRSDDRSVALAGRFAWPVLAPISSPFGPREGRHHAGIDLAANQGEAITAAREGAVYYAGVISGYGNTVILQHTDGTRTLYAHASKLLVRVGESIRQGETIALVGSTGHSTGPHLHFEIIVDDQARDPLRYLPKR